MSSETEISNYKVPLQHKPDGWSFDTRPKRAKAWIDELPLANTSETTRRVYDVVGELNTLKIDPADRFQILELFHPVIQQIAGNLQRHFSGRPLPLGEKSSKIYSLLQEINTQMAIGYKCVIVNAVSEQKRRIDTQMVATAIHRNLRYLSAILLHAFQIYSSYPHGTWHDIHQLYTFAEQNGLSKHPLRDPTLTDKPACSVEDIYKHILLLSLACPYRLRQGEIEKVNQALKGWVAAARLEINSEPKLANGIFVTQLDSDMPPTYKALFKGGGNIERRRILDTSKLADKLQAEIGEEAEESTSPLTRSGQLSHDLLRRLALAWGIVPTRGERRLNVSTEVELTMGLNAIFFHISGTDPESKSRFFSAPLSAPPVKDQEAHPDPFKRSSLASEEMVVEFSMSDEERARIGLGRGASSPRQTAPAAQAVEENSPYPAQQWHMVNVSAGGYCLLWNEIQISHAKVGELVGIRDLHEEDLHQWGIGVVRWMRSEGQASLKVGVEMLSPNTVPLTVELSDQISNPTGHWLLVQESPTGASGSSLITPPYPVRRGEKVLIRQHDKELYVQLTEMLENTGFFAQYQFKALGTPKSRDKPQAEPTAKPLEKDDSVWQLI